MSAQNFLTLLFDAIALSFIAITIINFITGLTELLMPRTKIIPVSHGQLNLFDLKPQPCSELPDPWTLPIDEVIEAPIQRHWLTQSYPLLLLPAAKNITEPVTKFQRLNELIAKVDLNKLPTLPARRIAKALGIAQKMNGKDHKLNVLCAQIKSNLQHPQSLSPEAIEAVRELLAS